MVQAYYQNVKKPQSACSVNEMREEKSGKKLLPLSADMRHAAKA